MAMQTGVMHLPQENMELASQLRRLESSFSVFAEESNPNQLLAHLGRMAVEFHHLSSKVQKNEQRTSLLQVRHLLAFCICCKLCELIKVWFAENLIRSHL